MSIFDNVKAKAQKSFSSLQAEVKKFKNTEFLNAVIAGCVLVAAEDDSISSEEKQKMIGFIQSNESLSVFKTDEVITAFQKFITKLEFDPSIGKGECLAAISKLRGKFDQSQLMVRVCIAIGSADGNFDQGERAVVATICQALELNPADYTL
jgi:tellurite resistance protein TerB